MVNNAEAPRPATQKPRDRGSDTASARPSLPGSLVYGPWTSRFCSLPAPPSLSPQWGSLSTSRPLQTKVLGGPGLLCKCTNFGQSETRISTQISRLESKVRVSSNQRSQKADVRAVLRRRAAGPSIQAQTRTRIHAHGHTRQGSREEGEHHRPCTGTQTDRHRLGKTASDGKGGFEQFDVKPTHLMVGPLNRAPAPH